MSSIVYYLGIQIREYPLTVGVYDKIINNINLYN